MKPWLSFKLADLVAERPAGADDDVHFTEALVATGIDEYTVPGDLVLDPFAGFGTTLVVAERMARRAVGVELLPERVDEIRGRLDGTAQVLNGDSRKLATIVDGPVDLCFTSPPYMTNVEPAPNPLTGYQTIDGDYATYLGEIEEVFRQVAELMRPGGHVVVNIANIVTGSTVMPLAWDVARAVSRHLTFKQEIHVCWDEQPGWLSADYCFVFQRPA